MCEDQLCTGLQQLRPGPGQGLGPGEHVSAPGEQLANVTETLASSWVQTCVFYVLKVMDAHRSSVRCLFLDELHLLSADVDGQVMAWSGGTDVKRCLMTFKHPK